MKVVIREENLGFGTVIYISGDELRREFFKLEGEYVCGFPIMMLGNHRVHSDWQKELWYKLRDDLLRHPEEDTLYILITSFLQTSLHAWYNCYDILIIRDLDKDLVQLNLESISLYNNILEKHSDILRNILRNPNKNYFDVFQKLGIYENQ